MSLLAIVFLVTTYWYHRCRLIRVDENELDGWRGEHTNTIKLACKDLKHDQGKAELTETGPYVGSFEGPLGGSNLDQFLG